MSLLRAPFPYFGKKTNIALEVWQRLRGCDQYIEPFFGSGAVLFASPTQHKSEIVNDLDGMLVNVWRSLQLSPEKVAEVVWFPKSELEVAMRHQYILERRPSVVKMLQTGLESHDPVLAGHWIYEACSTIGDVVHREAPQSPCISYTASQGIFRLGFQEPSDVTAWFQAFQKRLRRVNIGIGSWERVVAPSILINAPTTAIFLDPPYAPDGRVSVYNQDDGSVFFDVVRWGLEQGVKSNLKIAICGYEWDGDSVFREHGWQTLEWKTAGGYGNHSPDNRGAMNASRERVWFSPGCAQDASILDLFG